MEYRLPDIPVKPKLYHYKIDHKKQAQYEYSSVEINQYQRILVDFDMGTPLDLINRDMYAADPQISALQNKISAGASGLEKQLEELRLQYLDEKDRFILSESNKLQTPIKKPQPGDGTGVTYPKKLPASYRLIHREEKWGQDIKDPLASVRRISADQLNGEDIVMTGDIGSIKKDIAIQQIERRFAQVKNIKVGMQKGRGNDGVTAVKVFDFLPMVKLLNNKTVVVVCDDVIEDELLKGSGKDKIENNDFLLHSFAAPESEIDNKLQLDIHRAALYKHADSI